MIDTSLMEVMNDGQQLKMLDGSIWDINPGDMSIVCTWIPTANIKIKEGNLDSLFNSFLIYGDEIQVSARKSI